MSGKLMESNASTTSLCFFRCVLTGFPTEMFKERRHINVYSVCQRHPCKCITYQACCWDRAVLYYEFE